MAKSNIIKEFIDKQTSGVTIGVPKQKTSETQMFAYADIIPPGTNLQSTQTSKVGRPKKNENRVKLSVYLPEELKTELVKIQHHNYKPSMNEVLIEAIEDLIKKYNR